MIHVHVLYRVCAIKGTTIKYCMSGSPNYLILPLSDIQRARKSGVRISDIRLYFEMISIHSHAHGGWRKTSYSGPEAYPQAEGQGYACGPEYPVDACVILFQTCHTVETCIQAHLLPQQTRKVAFYFPLIFLTYPSNIIYLLRVRS